MTAARTLAAYDVAVPLEYRVALGAARTRVGSRAMVRCEVPELMAEVALHWPAEAARESTAVPPASEGATIAPPVGVVWVEPQRHNWYATLAALSAEAATGTRLAVVAARPAARLLAERRHWSGMPVGLRIGGISQFRAALRARGWRITCEAGMHSPIAIILNTGGQLLARQGRADLGDRLEFAARLRYVQAGLLAGLSTVALILATRAVTAC